MYPVFIPQVCPPSFLVPTPTFNLPPITYNIYTSPLNYAPSPTPPPFCHPMQVSVISSAGSISGENAEIQCEPPCTVAAISQDGVSMFVPPPSEWTQEQQSRTLILSLVPPEVGEEELKQELEAWGSVRALHREALSPGCVVVDYHDLRHAKAALHHINQRHILQQRMIRSIHEEKTVISQPFFPSSLGLIGGRAVWAQYGEPTALNQGTLVVFNLDTTLSREDIKSVFQQYGDVKEVRETSSNNVIKFVEFFDVRDAEIALASVDGKEVGSRRVEIQFSHAGNRARKDFNHFIRKPPRYHHYQQQRKHAVTENRNEESCTQQASATVFSARDNNNIAPTGMAGRRGRVRGSGGVFSSGCRTTVSKPFRIGWESIHEITDDNSFGYVFDEAEAESDNAQARTTVMIKNIPNKYYLEMLLEMLDNHCKVCNQNITNSDEPLSAYDFVYLPIDFRNQCNLGYAFVNFTSAKATWRLYREFHMHQWAVFKSKKICEITYAKIQGRRCLEDHFRNTKFACVQDEYLPLVFEPPRNGQDLTGGRVIANRLQSGNNNKQHEQQYSAQKHNIIMFGRQSCRCCWHGRTCNHVSYKPKIAASSSSSHPEFNA